MNTNTLEVADVMHTDEYYQELLICDTFRNLEGVTDRLIGRILEEDPNWLPRIPQAAGRIQGWTLLDNHVLLFADVNWKFDLEEKFPGVTAFMRHYGDLGQALRAATPCYDDNDCEITWMPQQSTLSDESWNDWKLLRVVRGNVCLSSQHRKALKVLDWPMAKTMIHGVLNGDGDAEFSIQSEVLGMLLDESQLQGSGA